MKKIIFSLLFLPLFALPQSSGTGFAINSDGYIATNHHVIDGANNIIVTGIDGDFDMTYLAKVIVEDKRNDLAILKIEKWLGEIPYKMNKSTLGKGNGVYALGYPLPSMLGIDINFADGKISKTSGFDNDPTYYKHSAPIQKGNSGGPLFSENGNLIAINTLGVDQEVEVTEGIFFSVKARYLISLIEEEGFSLPSGRGLDNYKIPQQVERIEKFVYLIIASNDNMNTNDIYKESPIFPSWDCNGSGNCYDPGTGKGQYLTQSTCQSNCIAPSWNCRNGRCIDPGTGNGTFTSLPECQFNCNDTPSWDCDGQGNCFDPGTGQGSYTLLSTCQSTCIAPSWDCNGSGNCYDPGTGKGQYLTQSTCQSNCIAPSWNCRNGRCIDPGTGRGVYSRLSTCEDNCSVLYLFLSYDFNNIPINFRFSYVDDGGIGFYFGSGFKSGKLPTRSGIFEVEDGQPIMYNGDALIGSFGPKIEESRSIYLVDIGLTTHLFCNIWWSGGLGWERNFVVEKREHFYDLNNNGSTLPEEYWGIEWIQNKDESSHIIFAETDVYLKIWRFTVKYGISYKHAAINSVVGVGFAF